MSTNDIFTGTVTERLETIARMYPGSSTTLRVIDAGEGPYWSAGIDVGAVRLWSGIGETAEEALDEALVHFDGAAMTVVSQSPSFNVFVRRQIDQSLADREAMEDRRDEMAAETGKETGS